MSAHDEFVRSVGEVPDWNARVSLMRQIPERFGTGAHAEIYAAIAKNVYVPLIQSEFALIHWRDDYELPAVQAPYRQAYALTSGFTEVTREHLADVIARGPGTLRIFRLFLGLLVSEFAEACALVSKQLGMAKVSKATIEAAEADWQIGTDEISTCATVIDLFMTRRLLPPTPMAGTLKLKIDKPDTTAGWETVREFAASGVPLPVLLHQRAYGGSFRQLLDATSSSRGDLLEDPVEELFQNERVPYIRTGVRNH